MMKERPFEPYKSRSIMPNFADVARMARVAERVSSVVSPGGLVVSSSGLAFSGNPGDSVDVRLRHKAKVAGINVYHWEQVIPDGSGNWLTTPETIAYDALDPTAGMPAFEYNNADITIDADASKCPVVRMFKGFGEWGYFYYGGGGSLTVQELDGAPAVANVTTIRLDQTDGLTLADDGTGTVTITIQDATTTQAGIVSTGDQTWNGDKSTQGGWAAIDTVNFSGGVFHSVGQGAGSADFWHMEESPGTNEMPYEQAAMVGAIKGASDRGYLSVSAGGTCGIAGETDLGLSQAKYSVRDGSTWKHGIYTTRTVQGAGVDAGLRITWEFAGGILVRETVAAGPSGSGSGTATDLDCCPGVALPNTLTMTFPDTTTDTLTFNGGNSWIGNVSGAMVGCYDLGSGIQWYLIYGGLTLPADGGGSCDPFSQTFTDGTDVYEVTE